MRKVDMICKNCIYSDDKFTMAEIGEVGQVVVPGHGVELGPDYLACRRQINALVTTKNNWCGDGIWQEWYASKGSTDIPSQWVTYAWGEWDNESD